MIFAPQLYRLQKSIILSEPTTGLFKQESKPKRVPVSRETEHGERYGDKGLWYRHMQEQNERVAGLKASLAALDIEERGLRRGRTIRESLEEEERKRSTLAAKRPTTAGIRTLDLGQPREGKSRSGLAATMAGQPGPGRRRMTELNRVLTNTIRQRNLAAAEDSGIEKEGGRVEPDPTKVMSGQLVKKPREDTQWTAQDETIHKMLRNHGTMLDFFDYSGVRVQDSKRLVDLAQPPSFGF